MRPWSGPLVAMSQPTPQLPSPIHSTAALFLDEPIAIRVCKSQAVQGTRPSLVGEETQSKKRCNFLSSSPLCQLLLGYYFYHVLSFNRLVVW